MEYKTVELKNDLVIPVGPEAETLTVELGWDPRTSLPLKGVKDMIQVAAAGSAPHALDLDLAAVIEYDGDLKADLIFHGRGYDYDDARSVILGIDDRTGFGRGTDEQIIVYLKKIPKEMQQITFFVNVHEGESNLKFLQDVKNVFVQIQEDGRTVFSETKAFTEPEAADSTSLVFAALARSSEGWELRGRTRYGASDKEHDVYEGLTGQVFRK